jgi:hypothetical protein
MDPRSSVLLSACAVLVFAVPAWSQDDPTMPPLPPRPGDRVRDGTEVHFLAYRGEEAYAVSAGEQSCTTPCTLKLRPGPTKVHVVGPGESDLQLVIPHLTAQVRIATGPPNWYFTAGVVMLPTGLVVAATMWMVGLACGWQNGGCMALNFVAWPVLGVAMFVTGTVLLGLYNRSQPMDANRPEILDARRERRRWRFEGFSLAPTREGASGLLSFTF